ncbi:MAG: hypothetical protein ACRDNK_15300 [Solirubrobacteraceae bacterium]
MHDGHPLYHAIIAACASQTPPARPACAASRAFTASQAIARSFQIISELTTEHGLVTSEMVPAANAIIETERRGGLRLARHDF